ncbi:MAG: carbon-nitrogen hydrolase family protein [Candidatus Glassbacteria bacterium]|nr:carbon-nitrogen hydrolase family protein [Candidatus Glassbacteria bacterium]
MIIKPDFTKILPPSSLPGPVLRYLVPVPALAALLLLAGFSGALRASGPRAEVLFQADSFVPQEGGSVEGWQLWSQRQQTRPAFFAAELPSLGGPGSLAISGSSNSSAHGCWLKPVVNIVPGNHYHFEASFHTLSVPYPRQQVIARLDWRRQDGGRAGQPEYVPEDRTTGFWQTVSGTFRAPDKAASVNIELFLSYCPQGTVWWDAVSLSRVAEPPPRMVRVATVNCYPRNKATPLEGVAEFCRLVDKAGNQGCDIICLGEGLNLVGVSGSEYPDIAEPVPGPTTAMLSELAKKHGMYIVASLGELDNQAIYNSAVLIDRQGRVAGKYRKVQLPREEVEAGVTPGNSLPVFDTDFGRIGMMICWDVQYSGPAQALAVQGAEVIFLPIWGGNPVLMKARAIENQVYLVSCAYSDVPSAIYDPNGEIIAEARDRPSLAFADIDLNRQFINEWLGNMRHRFLRERRADIRVPALER